MLEPRGGDVWRTDDGVTFRFYGPTLPYIGGGRNDINDNSLIFRIEYGSFRMLFTGDAGEATERRLLRDAADLRSSVRRFLKSAITVRRTVRRRSSCVRSVSAMRSCPSAATTFSDIPRRTRSPRWREPGRTCTEQIATAPSP